MMYIATILKSESPSELARKKLWIRKAQFTLFSTLMIAYTIPSMIVFVGVREFSLEYAANITIFRALLVVRSMSKIAIDIFMIKNFLATFFFFVQKKIESNLLKGCSFDDFNGCEQE